MDFEEDIGVISMIWRQDPRSSIYRETPKLIIMQTAEKKSVIGWREWVGLPDLGIDMIKTKIDTGARTSSLDSSNYEFLEEDGMVLVRFRVTFGGRRKLKEKVCIARVVEHRNITNSGGHVEERIVIATNIKIGELEKEIEITLTQRKNMKFRMLLGRTAISDNFCVDVARSYLTRTRQTSIL